MKGKHYLLVILVIVALVACASIISVAINNGYREVVSGGASISETVNTTTPQGGLREMEIAKVAFGGKVGYDRHGAPAGQWHINFHETANSMVDGNRFQATEITELEFKDIGVCLSNYTNLSSYGLVKFKANGRFDGQYGWYIIVWLTDFEEPIGEIDGARITLSNIGPIGDVYDSSKHFGGDFSDNHGVEECPDSWGTKIDGGKLQIH